MKNITKVEAKRAIEEHKNNTAWYGENNMSMFGEHLATKDFLTQMFINKGFGYAETECIINALVVSGAKIEK